MNEASVRREVYQMLRYRYGLWPDHFPDVPATKQPGRPDLIVMNPRAPGYYVEVKALNLGKQKSFSFAEIEESQRRWLTMWDEQRPHGSYLAVGTVGCPKRELFVVPWPDWLKVEAALTPYQNSLPYLVGPGYRRELQDNGLDFRILDDYRCQWIKRGQRKYKSAPWVLPKFTEWYMGVRDGHPENIRR